MKKILIVDDSAFMRSVLKDLLISLNQETIEFSEAEGKVDALEQMKKSVPDIILLDVVMKESETEGLEFIKEIKDFFDINKIIMISSVGQIAVQDECKRLGVTHYLQKPFEQNQIIEAVNKALA